MGKLQLKDLDVARKRVLVRVDFNVPLDDHKKITDDTRIRAALPTIQNILDRGGTPIIMSHLGRPKGTKKPEFSLAPCAKHLQTLLDHRVIMAPDCVGAEVEEMVSQLKPGEVILLENLRFHAGEEKPESDPAFAKSLAKLGECYVDDAFGSAHRAHTSIVPITSYFPSSAAAGLLLQKEIDYLGSHLNSPERPFIAIIGGAKLGSKLGVLHTLIDKVDALLIGGGMAYTFLKAKGISIGNSLLDDDHLETTKELTSLCKNRGVDLLLPEDIVIADRFANDASTTVVAANQGIPDGWEGLDIGPKTLKAWHPKISLAKTILWNGPLGAFEMPNFAAGTREVATLLADSQAVTIVGGGDSVAAINQAGLAEKFNHLSTGGGASLEYIQNGTLPGIDALTSH